MNKIIFIFFDVQFNSKLMFVFYCWVEVILTTTKSAAVGEVMLRDFIGRKKLT